ncbi:MAG: hypothetical protein JOZ72_01730 [Alphaproteobacteria bacterium]|nr:hypothetical protein [Alphaproteobacteria bacterium]
MLTLTAPAFAAGSTSDRLGGGVGGVGNIALSGVGASDKLDVVTADPGDGTSGNTVGTTGGGVLRTGAQRKDGQGEVGSTSGGSSGGGDTGGDSGGDTNTGNGASESEIVNKQVNLDTVWNNTNVEVDNVNGDVNASAAATANAFQAITFNNTVVNNDQYASGEAVGSDLNAQVTNINGSVNMSNIVACNTADVSTDPAYTVVNSKQECAVGDPSQATNVFAAQVQGDVNVVGSVAANVYTEDTNAKYNYVNTTQINSSAVNSTTNVQAYNVGGAVNVSSSAVGNTAQVVHY